MRIRFLCAVGLVFLLTACAEKPPIANDINRATNYKLADGTSKTYKAKMFDAKEFHERHGGEFSLDNEQSGRRAEKLSEAVTEIDGIDKASVIISGTTATVSISTTETELDDEKLRYYKNMVKQRVLKTDKDIQNVAVTAIGDLMEQKELVDSDSGNKLFQLVPAF
ncbi:hypothetical protein FACS1894188_00480 [Clostridia bacterium]|nr:hypothetical protein FACS1894188_00480 [Clostridia bacterium]